MNSELHDDRPLHDDRKGRHYYTTSCNGDPLRSPCGGLLNCPRVPLACLPTPLMEASRLAKITDGPRLWIKRDDMTGFGFGGNKIRGLEFLLADALAQGADTLVTGASPQSNYVRATAAGVVLACLQIGGIDSGAPPTPIEGNYRLTTLTG